MAAYSFSGLLRGYSLLEHILLSVLAFESLAGDFLSDVDSPLFDHVLLVLFIIQLKVSEVFAHFLLEGPYRSSIVHSLELQVVKDLHAVLRSLLRLLLDDLCLLGVHLVQCQASSLSKVHLLIVLGAGSSQDKVLKVLKLLLAGHVSLEHLRGKEALVLEEHLGLVLHDSLVVTRVSIYKVMADHGVNALEWKLGAVRPSHCDLLKL